MILNYVFVKFNFVLKLLCSFYIFILRLFEIMTKLMVLSPFHFHSTFLSLSIQIELLILSSAFSNLIINISLL